jgi:rRNA-processing protein FCF1
MEQIAQLINRYRNKGILIDTNILLLLFVGSTNRERIQRFKRTQQFIPADYDTLEDFLKPFPQIVVTPNILTEVNSLLNQLGEPERTQCLAIFGRGISGFDEQYVPSREIVAQDIFVRFGLTDTSILAAAKDRYLVLTDDLRLAQHLQSLDVDTVNFNNIRTLNW